MTKKVLNILAVSSILTSIAFISDGDPLEPNMAVRFKEFFGMIGIVFILVSFLYFISALILKNIRRHRVS